MNDGGPAFPTDAYHEEHLQHEGMRLRDWFAGQALAGMIADQSIRDSPEGFARVAYDIADAMLEARTREDP